MPRLPWVRLDSDLPTNKKILHLVHIPRGREALGVYCCSLAWSGANETDGYIPDHVLPAIHGKPHHAHALQDADLWRRNGNGWTIPNWHEYQPSRTTNQTRRANGSKAACIRWHGPDCGCWEQP